ncbi:MAG TPA: SRPBCC family protein [Pseudonocardia sp.]|jgi:hypothetical protein|nr:SRPBCC family protein [Pseudonocardia sp.]
MGEKRRVSSSTKIGARPEVVYALVTDLTRMGEWSPENTGGTWLGGATHAVEGARFKGTNEHGDKKWTTTVEVTEATEPSRFAFRNKVGPKTVSEWSYRITPTDGGRRCKVTETWVEGAGPILSILGKAITGVEDRGPYTQMMIEATLAKLKKTAESGA